MNKIVSASALVFVLLIGAFGVVSPMKFAYAQNDVIVDADGTASAGKGLPASRDVMDGDPLTDFPLLPATPSTGLDWFDQDANGVWTEGLDALHSEDPATCPGAIRDADHDLGLDCKVVDESSSLFDGDLVDCDVEVGANFNPAQIPVCPDPKMKFHDKNGDGNWNNGEDIVLDLNMNDIFDEEILVGGELLSIDTTALVMAGLITNASLVAPIIMGLAGIGIYFARSRMIKDN